LAEGPRIVVLGAGSVGCFIGGCWLADGLPITFVGRSRVADDVLANGLTVSDYSGWQRHLTNVDYRTDPAILGEADIVLLTVKSADTATAAQEIGQKCRKGVLVINFQNGVGNVDILRAELGDWVEIAPGMIPFNVAYLGAGRFHKGVAGTLFADERPATRALASAIGESKAAVRLSQNMLGLAWGKLLINLNNAVNALSGRTLLEELRERDYRRVVAASQSEGLRLLNRAGVRPGKVGAVSPGMLPFVLGAPDWLFNNLFMKSWKIDEKARSSMSDDLAAGRKTEVDQINGELVALAKRLGTDAPVNRAIVTLVHWAETGAKPWAPDALRREVLGR
jgi:2-dehydropantoate 2-reductase